MHKKCQTLLKCLTSRPCTTIHKQSDHKIKKQSDLKNYLDTTILLYKVCPSTFNFKVYTPEACLEMSTLFLFPANISLRTLRPTTSKTSTE